MSRYPWMPLYVGDYLGDTRHLSTLDHGAYILLIMHYWQHGGLPTDDHTLARIVGLEIERWLNVRSTIVQLFSGGEKWTHKRIDAELENARRRSDAGRKGGQASVKSRKRTTVERPFNDRGNDLASPTSTTTKIKKEILPGEEKQEKVQPRRFGRDTPWDEAQENAARFQPIKQDKLPKLEPLPERPRKGKNGP